LSRVFAEVAQRTAHWVEVSAHHANSSDLCAVCPARN
jgi:hypothetical protein